MWFVAIFVVCNSFESIILIRTSQEMLSLGVVQNIFRPISDLLIIVYSSVNVIIYVVFKDDLKEKLYELYYQVVSMKTRK